MGQIYTDSLVHDESALDYLLSTMGVDKVVLGSDYPFPLGEHHPGKLVEGMVAWDTDTKVGVVPRGVVKGHVIAVSLGEGTR